MPEELAELAAIIHAVPPGSEFPALSLRHPGLTLDEAYSVQRLHAELRAVAGDRPIGRKVAMNSPKRQREVGIAEPVSGRLYGSGRLANGGDIRSVASDEALIECELAFVLGRELRGPGVSIEDVLAATLRILPSFEIVERRSSSSSTIADKVAVDVSAAGVVLGTNDLDPLTVDRSGATVELVLDGEVSATSTIGEVLGDPALTVAWLANRVAALGEHLVEEEIVLTGTLFPGVAVSEARTIEARFGAGIGSVSIEGVRGR